MVRDTIQIGNPILKAPNKEIIDFNDPIFKQTVEDLIETMRKREHVGMAAPQIGENLKVFITEPRETKYRTKDQADELRIFVNPKIVACSKEEVIIWEGCGSFPDVFGPVKRPKEITIEALDLTGKKFRLTCDGILARVIQHEYDHLEGIQFIEKVTDLGQLKNTEFYIKDIKGLPELAKASVINKREINFI